MIQQEIPIIESVDIQTEIAFNNLCLQDGGGKEQRVILWQDPIRTFNLHKEIVYQVQLNQLREFFDLTKGSLESFFYRDKSDWQASRVKQLRSDVQTYGTLYGLGNNEYQVCKAYQVGSTIYLRPIACPFNLALFNGETLVTGWTLGDNGKVTFSGTFNSVSFDFYVPVRFQTDDLERQITAKSEPDNYVVYSIPKLVLKEVKIDFDENVVDTFRKTLDHILFLDLLKGTEIVQYQTDILSQESGFEKRSLVQETPTTINNLQARNIVYQDDIEYLIALWLCVKGEGASFYFDNGFGTNRVRFVSKALSYTCQSNALVYSLSGIEVKELPPPLSFTINLSYQANTSDPKTLIYFSFIAFSVSSIELGEHNTSSGGVGVNKSVYGIGFTGDPFITWIWQTAGGETLVARILVADDNGVTRYLEESDFIEPINRGVVTGIGSGTFGGGWQKMATPGASPEASGDLNRWMFESLENF